MADSLAALLRYGEIGTPGAPVSPPPPDYVRAQRGGRLLPVPLTPLPNAATEGPPDEAMLGAILRRQRPNLPFALPPLPQAANPNAVPPGQGLQPQTPEEAEALAADAQSFGVGATTALTAAMPMGAFLRSGQAALNMIPRAINAAPRASTAAAGVAGITGAGIATPEATPQQTQRAGPAPSDVVRELQIKLRDAGHYRGPIDGVMGTGTQQANQAFQAAETQRAQQALATAQNEVERQRAEAALRKIEADRIAEENRAEERAAGNQRMQDMERNVGPVQDFLRRYGGLAGLGTGITLGALLRGRVVKGEQNCGECADSGE